MSGGNAGHALAALVTQAPEEEDHAAGAAENAPSKLAQLCSCITGQKSSRSTPKLASVVPAGPPGDDKAAAAASASKPPEPAASASPALPSAKAKVDREEKAVAVQTAAKEERAALPDVDPADCIWGPGQNEPPQLCPQVGANVGRKTLVLDLDETLVHSSFRPTAVADIVITVELEGEHHRVYVRKRPGVDEFLVAVAKLYEVVVYTASMAKYANPLLDELDKSNTVHFRLFREACTRQNSSYIKDLSKLGRELKHVIIIDNSPICYAFQPDNAIPIRTWRDDTSDRELLDLVPILYSLATVEDIPVVLKQIVWVPDG